MAAGSELISVVCPVFNEEGGITEFYDRTSAAMQAIEPAINYELVFVDDGSRDHSTEILKTLAKDDDRISVIEFSRNFGHQLAITAGIDHARGDAVVIIDSDLQDPPEVIGGMIERWRGGFDVVYGTRLDRPGESKFKLATARSFYRIINFLSDVELPLDAGDFRLLDRRVVEALRSIREENRYMRGLVSWVGFKQTGLPYSRDERFAGETHYPLRKMMHFATDGITSFSEKPLKIATSAGVLVTIAAFVIGIAIIVAKIVSPDSQLPGYASLMAAILFLGGIQLLSVGILGQYVGRTYREAKGRPLYVVANRVNTLQPDVITRRRSDRQIVISESTNNQDQYQL